MSCDLAKLTAFQGEDIPLSKEYNEVLKDCTALATNLLSLAVNGEAIKRCWESLFGLVAALRAYIIE